MDDVPMRSNSKCENVDPIITAISADYIQPDSNIYGFIHVNIVFTSFLINNYTLYLYPCFGLQLPFYST